MTPTGRTPSPTDPLAKLIAEPDAEKRFRSLYLGQWVVRPCERCGEATSNRHLCKRCCRELGNQPDWLNEDESGSPSAPAPAGPAKTRSEP